MPAAGLDGAADERGKEINLLVGWLFVKPAVWYAMRSGAGCLAPGKRLFKPYRHLVGVPDTGANRPSALCVSAFRGACRLQSPGEAAPHVGSKIINQQAQDSR
jgi:hypothetical protein